MPKRNIVKVTLTESQWDLISSKVPKGDISTYVVMRLSTMCRSDLTIPENDTSKKRSRNIEISDPESWNMLMKISNNSKLRPASIINKVLFSPLLK